MPPLGLQIFHQSLATFTFFDLLPPRVDHFMSLLCEPNVLTGIIIS